MKKYLIQFLSIALLIGTMTSPLSAQVKKEKQKKETPKQVHVDLKDGKHIEGKLLERIGDTVVIESDTFIAHVNIKNIKNIQELNSNNTNFDKYLYNENKHAPHGFFAPTGFGLRKGEGYYKNFYLFVNHLNYGFTDNFSIELSTETLSLLAAGNGVSPFQVIYAVPKISYTVAKDVNLGLGVYIAHFGSDIFGSSGNGANVGIPFGVTTLGNRDNNFSIGLGTLLFAPSANETNIFVASLSGQLRLAKNFGLVTENYLFRSPSFGGGNASFPLGSIGMRYMSDNFSFDLGINNLRLPVLGFSVPFGRKK
jgi:hypothetical protein